MTYKTLFLVHQGVWKAIAGDGRPPPMPLACGYLKAAVERDPELSRQVRVQIVSLSGGESEINVLRRLAWDQSPDMVGFSVLGWNYGLFGRVAEALKALRPDTWIVFGGNHVANQADRLFRDYRAVDVLANGEGEQVFVELLHAFLGGESPRQLDRIEGISFRNGDGQIVTTAPSGRIQDLDSIPSPFLTGALQLVNERGEFAYESALLETNRGCPYRCSFCYWGGAVGQRVRNFSLDRLSAEVEVLARGGAEQIMLCDANFGMLPRDEEFLEICIKAREKHGFPRRIMTSWAKDKKQTFYKLVRRMSEAGFHSSFNLALQSLSEPALESMHRRNMRINEWQDLAAWLRQHDMAVYAELIWGCPGETCESFVAGYDQLARHVARIATYPLLLLPNTHYAEHKQQYGMATWRTGADDFERVLSHDTMSISDNRRMHGFLFWSRVLAEHLLLRHIWQPLTDFAGVTQSRVLFALDAWVLAQTDDAARRLRRCRDRASDELDLGSACIEQGLQFFFRDPDADALMFRWWNEAISPLIPGELRELCLDLFRLDWLSRPIYAGGGQPALPSQVCDGEPFYVRRNMPFQYDVAAVVQHLAQSGQLLNERMPSFFDIYYRQGFCNNMALYHNAQNEAYFGIVAPAHAREESVESLAAEENLPQNQ